MSSWANMSAPAWMRVSTQSSRPSEAAKCSGVAPEFVLLSKKLAFNLSHCNYLMKIGVNMHKRITR